MAIGQKVKLGIARQSAFNTQNTSFVPIKVESYNHATDIDMVGSEEMFNTIDKYDTLNGLENVNASLAGRVYPGIVGNFFSAAFGTPTTTGTAPNFKHVWNGSGSDLPPPYTIGVEAGDRSCRVVNARLTSVGLQQDSGQPLKFTSEWIATQENFVATTVSGTPEVNAFGFKHFTLAVGGTATPNFRTLSLTINNPIENIHTLNTEVEAIAQEFSGLREILLNGTIRYTTFANSYMSLFKQGSYTDFELLWQISTNTALQIELPRVKFTDVTISKGAGIVDVSFDAEAFFDGVRTIRVELDNQVASY